MTNIYRHVYAGIVMAFGVFGVSSCSDSQLNPELSEDGVTLTIARGSDEVAESNSPTDICIFRQGTLVKILQVNDPANETVNIKEVGEGGVYVANGVSLDLVEGTSTEADIKAASVQLADGVAPLFYSGYTPLNDEIYAQGSMTIDLLRSVARIDLTNQADPNITVNEIIVENAPSESYVFAGENALNGTPVKLTHSFSTPFQGVEQGVFTIFESDNPVTVRIRGLYGDKPMDMTTTLPRVERNRVYTLQVVNAGAKIETSFSVSEWIDGDTVGAGADTSARITIDADHSVIPEGVTVDYDNNIVNVPATGAEGLKLAFRADAQIEFVSIEGAAADDQVEVNPLEVLEQGYLSSVTFSIKPQTKGKLGYSILLDLKNALLENSYDYVEVKVAPSPHQIETVTIGGHEWMCFNSMGPNLEDQIYILDGVESVDQMYNENFVSCVGSYFQYLRPNPYSMWTANDPNAVAKPEVSGWTDPQYMPLPEGYHVPSFAEWEDLIPNGCTIPSEYTCRAGERIKLTIVTLPGTLQTPVAAINNQNYLMRYLLIESLDTGNKLYLPYCCGKTASSSVTPYNRFESIALYWVSNDRKVWYITTSGSGETLTSTAQESAFNYNGFIPVRGIKNAQ